MRHIEHLAIQPDGAKTRRLLDDIDAPASIGDFLRARPKRPVDDLNLPRMNGELADKAHPPIAQAFALQPLAIAEINEYAAARLGIDRPRRRERQRAGEQIGLVIVARRGLAVTGGGK